MFRWEPSCNQVFEISNKEWNSLRQTSGAVSMMATKSLNVQLIQSNLPIAFTFLKIWSVSWLCWHISVISVIPVIWTPWLLSPRRDFAFETKFSCKSGTRRMIRSAQRAAYVLNVSKWIYPFYSDKKESAPFFEYKYWSYQVVSQLHHKGRVPFQAMIYYPRYKEPSRQCTYLNGSYHYQTS